MIGSRLRIRLAGRFGAAFFVCLVALDVGLYLYLHGGDDRRLTRQLQAAGAALAAGVRRQEIGSPGALPAVVRRVLNAWPGGPESFAIFDAADRLLGVRAPNGPSDMIVAARRPPGPAAVWEVAVAGEASVRIAQVTDTAGGARLRLLVARSTADLRQHDEALVSWLGTSLPIVLLFALVAGYHLAGRALTPIEEMGRAIGAIAPDALDRRLPVGNPPDELDALADQFNRLLARLAEAQARNQVFLAQAAHQLKTPLTIVRGESALGLDHPREPLEYEASLCRIHRAA